MDKIRIFYDKQGNTLNVWFDDPEKEYICEETSEEVILVKDKTGRVIGFERLNFLTLEAQAGLEQLPVEAIVT
ncbi:MAG: DUF2283 domain-containing protein [Dehalococcoidia bacterium]